MDKINQSVALAHLLFFPTCLPKISEMKKVLSKKKRYNWHYVQKQKI